MPLLGKESLVFLGILAESSGGDTVVGKEGG